MDRLPAIFPSSLLSWSMSGVGKLRIAIMKSRLSELTASFRKYHRLLALIVCLPLTLTVTTGMLATIAGEWTFMDIGISRSLILSIHTGEIFKFQAFYPILNGLGLIGLLVTGLSMSGLFGRRSKKAKTPDSDL